ncbi:MAG: A/G-specific adenine glycosylase [Planctomycetaceae bacterium]|jgi:A/G-specific adenine glycosylase|nr:A/G-specific adenine glycosylase [Planctomycetaceae bacterium]
MLLDNSAKLTRFRRQVLDWFAANARQMPWRETTDPYRIWVSEVMLQQTTTKTVGSYYSRFVERFPAINVLAAAELDEVNRYWEGLGYYRRCSQMHKAAQEVVDRFNGQFPRKYEDVLKLPGIGRYTAGAVLSLAFDERLPILEANTERLYSRLIALPENPKTSESQKQLWAFADRILPKKNVGRFNLALMDIGNAVCTVKEPDCTDCPVVRYCEAVQAGIQHLIPLPLPKEKHIDRTEVALLIRKNQKILMIRYHPHQRWAGLWDFPRAESAAEIPLEIAGDAVLQRRLAALTGRQFEPGKVLKTLKHCVTRYRITLYFCEGTDNGAAPLQNSERCESRWVSAAELAELPLHSTARKLALFLEQAKVF